VADPKRLSMIGPPTIVFNQGGRRYEMTVSDEGESTTVASAEAEDVGGSRVPKWIELTTTGGAGPDMFLRVEVRDGSPQVVELGWKVRPAQREIRQKDLRGVDVAKLAVDLYASWVAQTDPYPRGPDGSSPDFEQISEWSARVRDANQVAMNFLERQRRPREYREMTDEKLRLVAEVYRANINKRAPTQAVAKHFAVGNRMASTYVTKAREKGFLPKTKRGKKQA